MKTCHCSQLSGSCLIIIFSYRDCKRSPDFHFFDPGKCVNIPGHRTHDGKKMESLCGVLPDQWLYTSFLFIFFSFIYLFGCVRPLLLSVQVSLVVAHGYTHPMASVILVPTGGLNP